jgi:CelD/BcsL family acetyltransferase involved in cellulose biosynthesis
VFTRDPAATFRLVTDKDEALRILSTTEVQQGARMQNLGLNFILNDETCAAFYRNLVRDGVGHGYALVSALTAGDEVVATLLGIRNGSRYVMIRISNAGEKWSNCSPGRLIIERTMAALHRDGVREFDFSIGNYAYKRRFGVTRIPLVDLSAALSWRGLPYALRDRAARELRNYPKIAAYLKRALGKPPSREEN